MVRNGNKANQPYAVEFRVAWDQERGHFAIFRGTERTASFSLQQGTAVGLAILEAQQETILGGTNIIVTSRRNGKRVVEWDRFTLHQN